MLVPGLGGRGSTASTARASDARSWPTVCRPARAAPGPRPRRRSDRRAPPPRRPRPGPSADPAPRPARPPRSPAAGSAPPPYAAGPPPPAGTTATPRRPRPPRTRSPPARPGGPHRATVGPRRSDRADDRSSSSRGRRRASSAIAASCPAAAQAASRSHAPISSTSSPSSTSDGSGAAAAERTSESNMSSILVARNGVADRCPQPRPGGDERRPGTGIVLASRHATDRAGRERGLAGGRWRLQRLPGRAGRLPAAGRPRVRDGAPAARLLPAAEVDAVLVTHGHPDHCADLNPLLRARELAGGRSPRCCRCTRCRRAGRGARPGRAADARRPVRAARPRRRHRRSGRSRSGRCRCRTSCRTSASG